MWSANEAEAQASGHHVVVATVAKLQNCVDDPEYEWLASPSCVVIDEAHGAIAPVYTRILTWLGVTPNQSMRPLVGLTATPYRGTSETQTARLVNRFYGNRLDDGALGEDQYATLQEMGVLARVEHELLDGVDLELTAGELAHLEQTRLVPTSASRRLAANVARNEGLLASVRRRAANGTVLLFAASVEHAEVLAARLSTDGIPAGAISSRTPMSARRHFIDRFRKGEIRVLTNYAVLTEGFDAPAVGAVYVARPDLQPEPVPADDRKGPPRTTQRRQGSMRDRQRQGQHRRVWRSLGVQPVRVPLVRSCSRAWHAVVARSSGEPSSYRARRLPPLLAGLRGIRQGEFQSSHDDLRVRGRGHTIQEALDVELLEHTRVTPDHDRQHELVATPNREIGVWVA